MPEEKVCCPEFDPKLWDNKTHVWKDKLFARDSIRTFLHIPFGGDKVITAMCQKIEAAQAAPAPAEFLMLFNDPTPWRSVIRMAVTKAVPGLEMTTLSGTFQSRVFEGPYRDAPKWIKAMGLAKDYHIHYAYCPKCSKKYGHNYGVVFAQVA